MTEGTVPVPHTAPALCDDNLVPVGGYRIRGSHSGGGETPMSVNLVIEHFSRAIIIFFEDILGGFATVTYCIHHIAIMLDYPLS